MRYCCRECTTARPRDQVRRKTEISHMSLPTCRRSGAGFRGKYLTQITVPGCARRRLSPLTGTSSRHETAGRFGAEPRAGNRRRRGLCPQELDCCTNPRDEEEQVQRCEPRQPDRQHEMHPAQQAGGDADEQQLSCSIHANENAQGAQRATYGKICHILADGSMFYP